MKKTDAQFSARIFSFYRFTSNAIFYAPIIVLYFKDIFASELRLYILITAYTLTITIFEVPSGILADVKGNYKTLVSGLILSAIGTAMLVASSSFALVLVGQILVGIGLSLKSGTESAYIRKVIGEPEYYQKIEAKTASFRYVGLAVSSILGAYLFVVNYSIPFIITSLLLLFSVMLLSFLPSKSDQPIRRQKGSIYKDIVSVFNVDFQFSLTFIFIAIVNSALGLMYWTYALYLEEINFSVEIIGVTFALLFIASSVGSYLAHYVARLSLNSNTFYGLCLVLSLIVIGYGFVTTQLGVILIYLTHFLTGMAIPIGIMFIQQNISDSVRASVLSISSLGIRAFQSLLILLFGMIHNRFSLSTAYFFLGYSLIVMVVIFAMGTKFTNWYTRKRLL